MRSPNSLYSRKNHRGEKMAKLEKKTGRAQAPWLDNTDLERVR